MEDIICCIMIALLILGVIGLFVYVGFEIKNSIEFGDREGIVIDKKYHAAYTTMSRIGKRMVPIHHSERYEIQIQKEVNGENRTIWVTVDKDTYNNLNIEDYYPKRIDEVIPEEN